MKYLNIEVKTIYTIEVDFFELRQIASNYLLCGHCYKDEYKKNCQKYIDTFDNGGVIDFALFHEVCAGLAYAVCDMFHFWSVEHFGNIDEQYKKISFTFSRRGDKHQVNN